MSQDLIAIIDAAWEDRANINLSTQGDVRQAVDKALALLDKGELRVAEPTEAGWQVNQWAKKAVLLSFRLNDNVMIDNGPGAGHWWDKVPSKFAGWDEAAFRADEGTMVDTWVTVGSCAQIGKNVHLSGGVGIGGVLEPLQADPVIIEDDCFIGARSEVVEGVRIGKGSVLSMGVFIGQSTKIIDRATGEVFMGEVPPYSVVVPGSLPGKPLPDGTPGPSLYCAVIVKRVDAQTRSKTGINELLRD
ncbi:MAG: 2,3,4,5-tetrahydropyridine-2,6-dicarboxylate N-succinyltransferase [Sphingobium sp.]|nr:MAG: 2,3,4,5-tetrahydropyridine-2,6-dicarboxylate N-succinyltransferase [Sphingobium sp.]